MTQTEVVALEESKTKTGEKQSKGGFGALAVNYGVVFFLVLLAVLFTFLLPATFPTETNIRSIFTDQAIPLIMAIAAVLPLAAGEFDLSIGATLGFTAITAISLSNAGLPLILVILIAIAFGALIGAFNAFLIVVIGVNAFIATLAMATVLGGLNILITKSSLLVLKAEDVSALATTRVLGLQIVLFYAVVIALIAWYLLEFTPFGRYLRATGMGREAARLSGVRTNRFLAIAFIGAGVLAAIAGVLFAARGGTAPPGLGPEFLLPAYAAAFLGATTIKPGYFNIWGTVIGVLLLAVGSNGLILLGAQTWVTNVFNGVALMIAVSASVLVGRRKRRA